MLQVLVLFCSFLVWVSPSWAARETNGTNQCLQSSTTLTLGAPSKVTIAAWIYMNVSANDDQFALEYGSGNIYFDPNAGGGGSNIVDLGNVGATEVTFTRPSAAAWHHWVVSIDLSLATSEIVSVHIDGSARTLTYLTNLNNTNTLANSSLFLMSSGCSSLWGAGRIAEVAVWAGINLSAGDVTSLYNSGAGALATSVQGGSLVHYWKLCGTASPEPATVGTPTMTVTGATFVAHPINTCAVTIGGVKRRPIIY